MESDGVNLHEDVLPEYIAPGVGPAPYFPPIIWQDSESFLTVTASDPLFTGCRGDDLASVYQRRHTGGEDDKGSVPLGGIFAGRRVYRLLEYSG